MIEAWFDEDSSEPTVIETPADLDAVLDAAAKIDGPTLVNLHAEGDFPWIEVGLHGDRGTLRYVGDDNPNGAYSKNTGTQFPLPSWGEVRYYYMRNEPAYPNDAEIPIADVHKAAHEFLSTGGARPALAGWTEQVEAL